MKTQAIRYGAVLIVVLLCCSIANQTLRADVPTSPKDVCPILVGSQVPSVLVQSVEGDSLDLREAVRAKPTILIFYRGGW